MKIADTAIQGMSTETKRRLVEVLRRGPLWRPFPARDGRPHPQQMAIDSPADVIGFGGAAGGGKTDLIIGLALTRHTKSLIVRREAVQLGGIEERIEEIVGSRQGYNGSTKTWRLGGRRVQLGSMKEPQDWIKHQGRPNDLIAFDEAAHFLETQVRSLIGWNRTVDPTQRCRVVLGFNPPTTPEAQWIVEFFAPWLDPSHRRPAEVGEVRWFVTQGSRDIEVDGPGPVEIGGEMRTPRSRTFIRSRVEDNPTLMATGYRDHLDGMPEPLRSMLLYGDFSAGSEDDEWQVIPTAWVDAAIARWTPDGARGVPMSALGCDPARGGQSETALCARHGWWFSEIFAYPGQSTPDGGMVAGLAMSHVRDGAPILIDATAIGSSPVDHLRTAGAHVIPVYGATAVTAMAAAGGLGFLNRRAMGFWRLREALDPASGRHLALPSDARMRADLCSPRWKPRLRSNRMVIQVESKDEIMGRLGRSVDRGDCVVYALEDHPRREGGVPPERPVSVDWLEMH